MRGQPDKRACTSPVLPGARLPPADSGANPSRRMTQQAARQRQGGGSSPLTSRSPPSFQTWLDASADGISARAGISAAKPASAVRTLTRSAEPLLTSVGTVLASGATHDGT